MQHCLVSLDYCNALEYNSSAVNLAKLQRVQSTLTRVMLRQRQYDHITPTLVRLHWLPTKYGVIFKLATLTYKTLHHTKHATCAISLPVKTNQFILRVRKQKAGFRSTFHVMLHNLALPDILPLLYGTIYRKTFGILTL